MLEKNLRNEIINELKDFDFIPIYLINTNIIGIADLLVLCPDSHSFFVEIKLPNNNQQSNQKTISKYFLERADTKTYIVKCVEDIKKVIHTELKNYNSRLENRGFSRKWRELKEIN